MMPYKSGLGNHSIVRVNNSIPVIIVSALGKEKTLLL
jgi:hypothetical protein